MWKYDWYQILENTVDKTKKHSNSPNTIGTHITGLAMNSTFHSASGKEEKAKTGKETVSGNWEEKGGSLSFQYDPGPNPGPDA